jgi:hypothetical protein
MLHVRRVLMTFTNKEFNLIEFLFLYIILSYQTPF